MDTKRIGQRLQSVRKSRRMTQAALAQAADLSVKYVSNIECGNKIPTLETFITIANALQIDANTLLSDVLDVSVSEESGDVSSKLAELAPSTQRKFLHVLDALIDEFGES